MYLPDDDVEIELTYEKRLAFGPGDVGELSADGFDSIIIAYAVAMMFESQEHSEKSTDRWWGIYGRRLKGKISKEDSPDGREFVAEIEDAPTTYNPNAHDDPFERRNL